MLRRLLETLILPPASVLLLFLIGTELSLRFFMVTWKMALGAVALQVAGSLGAIFLCSVFLGFSAAESVLQA